MTAPAFGVAVLFARRDSCYADLAAEVFDADRDARTYAGGLPVVAHPPCRAWGRLAHLAKPREGEAALALFALAAVRRCGGVLEHPFGSRLWKVAGLPPSGAKRPDEHGGYTLLVRQEWWGHPAPKPTLLYVVGRRPTLDDCPVPVTSSWRQTSHLSAAGRERTPPEFARWLCALAEGCA